MAEDEPMDYKLCQGMHHLPAKQNPDPQEENPTLQNNNNARHETLSQIALDLITGLPQVNGKDAILTIVDHGCSRAAIFIPFMMTITRPGIAQLYLRNIYPWFGLPSRVISDRDPRCYAAVGIFLAASI